MKVALFAVLCELLIATVHAESITCNGPVPAFDPANPTKQIGSFAAGTTLEIQGSKRADGLVVVLLKQGTNPPVQALCNYDVLQKASKLPVPGQFGRSQLYSQIANTLVDANFQALSRDRQAKLANSKYVLVYFADDSDACNKFTPELVQFYNDTASLPESQTEVLLFSRDDSAESFKTHINQAKIPFPIINFGSLSGSPLKSFGEKFMPQLVLLSEKGELLSSNTKGEEFKNAGIVLSTHAEIAKLPGWVKLTLESAFRISQMEEAKKKAIAENKPIGVVCVWDSFFNAMENGKGTSGTAALTHFYLSFKDTCVLVFVRHETELGTIPSSVGQAYASPDAGGFSPKMAVISPDAQETVCMIRYAPTWEEREKIFDEKHKVIDEYFAKKKAATAAAPIPPSTPSAEEPKKP